MAATTSDSSTKRQEEQQMCLDDDEQYAKEEFVENATAVHLTMADKENHFQDYGRTSDIVSSLSTCIQKDHCAADNPTPENTLKQLLNIREKYHKKACNNIKVAQERQKKYIL